MENRISSAAEADVAAMHFIGERLLLHLDGHVEALVAELKDKMVEYRSVPVHDVSSSTEAIVRAVVGQLTSLSVEADDVAALGALAQRRAEQGFPPEALTRSIQLGARHVLKEADRIAAEAGVDASTMLRVHDYGWRFATDAASVIAKINHELAVDIGKRESGRQSDFLRAMLRGAMPTQQINAEARIYGLDPAARYHTLRARPEDHRNQERLSMAIRRTCTTHLHRPVLGVVEGDLVGLVPQRPTLDDDQPTLVALGEPTLLTDAAHSFRAASLVFDTGRAFGRTGVVTLDDLGPLPLVLMGDDLAPGIESRYLGQLEKDRPAGLDVERTVWTWLQCDQSVDDVAKHMHVHRNTVRYRLTRFRELTSLDVRRTDDLILTWWLLGRRSSSHPASFAAAARTDRLP